MVHQYAGDFCGFRERTPSSVHQVQLFNSYSVNFPSPPTANKFVTFHIYINSDFLSIIFIPMLQINFSDSEAAEASDSRASAVCATCVFEAALRNDELRFEQLLRSGPLESLFVPILLLDVLEWSRSGSVN